MGEKREGEWVRVQKRIEKTYKEISPQRKEGKEGEIHFQTGVLALIGSDGKGGGGRLPKRKHYQKLTIGEKTTTHRENGEEGKKGLLIYLCTEVPS